MKLEAERSSAAARACNARSSRASRRTVRARRCLNSDGRPIFLRGIAGHIALFRNYCSAPSRRAAAARTGDVAGERAPLGRRPLGRARVRLEPAHDRRPAEPRRDATGREPVDALLPGPVVHAVPDALRPELQTLGELGNGQVLVAGAHRVHHFRPGSSVPRGAMVPGLKALAPVAPEPWSVPFAPVAPPWHLAPTARPASVAT